MTTGGARTFGNLLRNAHFSRKHSWHELLRFHCLVTEADELLAETASI